MQKIWEYPAIINAGKKEFVESIHHASTLLPVGIHPTIISESFQRVASKAVEILDEMSTPLQLSDRDSLLKSATTSLNSKVTSTILDSFLLFSNTWCIHK